MPKPPNNVLQFGPIAGRKTRSQRRTAELQFKARDKGSSRAGFMDDEHLLTSDLIALVDSSTDFLDSFRRHTMFWRRVAKKREKELAKAEKRIAKLEKKIAKLEACQ